jgi:hypothetical protein
MFPPEIKHYQVNGKYRIKIERAASTKGVLGYTVEANGDNIDDVWNDVFTLKSNVEKITPLPAPEAK